MVQDWGGPIGLTAASRDAGRYRAVISGNTWAWPMTGAPARAFSGLLGGPIGRALIERYNLFADKIVDRGHARRKLSPEEKAHYTNPFPDAASRKPTHVFPREITHARALLEEAEVGLSRLNQLPALIVWGNKDQAFRKPELRRWESTFGTRRTHVLDGAGHYIQDDAGDEIVATIKDWWPPA